MQLPASLRRFFWNCRFEDLDTAKHKNAIIETLLEYGDIEAWRWMLRNFTEEEIVGMLRRSRILAPHTRGFWSLYFHVDLSNDIPPGDAPWWDRHGSHRAR